jgi:hypothetical protein
MYCNVECNGAYKRRLFPLLNNLAGHDGKMGIEIAPRLSVFFNVAHLYKTFPNRSGVELDNHRW